MKKHGSLFSGIGGWSVASDQMEWETLFMCEWDKNKQYVLKSLWPKSEIYGDITSTDFTIWRGKIDILTASTPCQPFSLAGKREGANDYRHLWPETIRAIREIQPPWFVLENVPGLVNWSKGMVFKQIITDLENEGYEVLPFLLPACGVNAPHRRERIWIVAYSASYAVTGQNRKGNTTKRTGVAVNESIRRGQLPAIQYRLDVLSRHAPNPGLQRPEINEQQTTGIKQCSEGVTSDTNSQGFQIRESESENDGQECATSKRSYCFPTYNAIKIRLREQSNRDRNAGFINETSSERNWANFPTISPLRTGDDGFSCESLRSYINENSGGLLTEKEVDTIIQKSLNKWNNETIAAGGDAVVPQVVYQIFKAIQQYEKHNPLKQ